MTRSFSLVLLVALLTPCVASAQVTLTVGPTGTVRTLTEALDRAAPGTDIRVQPGVYREPTLQVDTPVSITALGEVVIDGEGERTILRVTADSVALRGLTFRNVGASFVEDRSALLVEGASGCRILENRFEDVFFAIYLAETSHCEVIGNVFRGPDVSEARAGNAIHLWYSRNITVRDNDILGHRDGIYFEFVEDSIVENNLSVGNLRYGLHFMFSDNCRYTDNTFRANGAGVAVMYTEGVVMRGNAFEDNWGPAAFGLLLKEITDSEIVGNTFAHNTVGLYAEGSNRMQISENTFESNGWAIKIMADAMNNELTRNNFVGNSFDVGTNSRQSYSSFSGNYWDAYEGYDLDRDGVGDVPFRPVRLFALIVEQHEPAMMLMRSLFVQLLDIAERVAPALTPETLVDDSPAMRPLSI